MENNNLVHCGTRGTWQSLPQSPDVFGVREIPIQPEWLEGYRGELRFPPVSGRFLLPNGTNISIPCTSFPVLSEQLVFETSTCAYPLINIGTAGADLKCVLPCPFPVIPLSEQKVIGWAFIIPGLLGMVFSVFVCLDTIWVIFDSTQGFGYYDRIRIIWARTGDAGSSPDASSLADGRAVNDATPAVYPSKRTKVRSSSVFALLGSLLGILYFMVGPLMTLLNFETISCDGNSYFDISDLLTGQVELGNSMCQAQRIAPFILQGIFNLMLYALFRVLLTVDQRFKQWNKKNVAGLQWTVLAYCSLGPFVTMGIALGLDKTTDDITQLYGQLARSSAVCTMRLSTGQEFVLIFIPFIITGCSITVMSFYIWGRLSSIQAGVKSIQLERNRASDQALRSLMLRLSGLGLTTFIVIIILMASTGYVIQSMATFSPRFNAWFACETTTTICADNLDCNILKDDAYAVSPTFEAFAVQIAAMSCISLLLSGFFTAQAAPRAFRDWWSGILSQKLDNILEGRPLHYQVRSNDSKNGDEAHKASPSPTGESSSKNRIAPSKANNSVVAQVASSDARDVSLVFESELMQSKELGSQGGRVQDSSQT